MYRANTIPYKEAIKRREERKDGRVSRLEEIKNRTTWEESMTVEATIAYKIYKDDVEHLLSKLEVAEKALQKVFADQGFVYLRDALDKIRE